ncbi:MAG: hypothetical protein IPN58_17300 [Anaerolineales bacterium]|nr:hypothetical protein [Anaerolineales bacterium]
MLTLAAPTPFGLTADQAALYHRLVPKQVDHAAAHVIRELRVKQQEHDLKQEGAVAIGTGIPRLDPAEPLSAPDTWGRYVAMYAMLDFLRAEGRYQQQMKAVRLAVMLHCAFHTDAFEADRDGIEEAREKLTKYGQRVCAGTLVRLAATPITAEGEDGAVMRESQRRIVEVLQRLVSELRPEQRELLRRAYAYDHASVKKAAEELGEKGYRAVLRAYHELLEVLGARLAREGFDADNLPLWPDEASGTILGPTASSHQRHG